MKRKLMLGLLSAVGGLTIIGSGFSAWYFGDSNIVKNSNIDAHVTPLASAFGEITTSDISGVSLQLDQGGYENAKDVTKGISFTYGTESTFNSDITGTYTISGDNSKKANDAGLKATFECVVTLKKEYAEFIEFKDGFYGETFTRSSDTAGNTTINLSKPITFGVGLTETFTFHVSTNDQKVNTAFQYKENKKPTNSTDFAKLYALNDKASNVLTFNYSLKVVSK
ncbi:MAG: hypothetical protein MR606_03615 [Mollicutes bacterium]|nr:hypothetical protein [Mollicutes bacterium]MDD7263420.1 hypothetical protein [bacterium]MDY4980031.1 hypothetical protein [Candidatus Onthovivens sp.]